MTLLDSIPDISKYPLEYVMNDMKIQHKPETLWLEFGSARGNTINYISKFTNDYVYGFDSFEGLPEKWREGFDIGTYSTGGNLPIVNDNVILIKGLFSDTLPAFTSSKNKKISFIHMDADLYSSTIYVLNTLKDYIDDGCVIVFNNIVNYPEFEGETGAWRAFGEFVSTYSVNYEFIGMNGGMNYDFDFDKTGVAVNIHSIP